MGGQKDKSLQSLPLSPEGKLPLTDKPGRERYWAPDGVLVEVLPDEVVSEIAEALRRPVSPDDHAVKAMTRLMLRAK